MYLRIGAHTAQEVHTHSCKHNLIQPDVCTEYRHHRSSCLDLHSRAGKDAARAFATGCFKEHQTHDIRELDEDEIRVRGSAHVHLLH